MYLDDAQIELEVVDQWFELAEFCLGGLALSDLHACTGITLKAKDGTVVNGRTMEWGTFDLKARVVNEASEDCYGPSANNRDENGHQDSYTTETRKLTTFVFITRSKNKLQ